MVSNNNQDMTNQEKRGKKEREELTRSKLIKGQKQKLRLRRLLLVASCLLCG